MREVLADIEKWQLAGQSVALATVVQTWGSSPRGVGAKMAFTAAHDIAGSVSGGCIEGAVITAGEDLFVGGVPQLLHFGVADEMAWDVGLACGGIIEVWVEALDTAVYTFLRDLIQHNRKGVALTILQGPADLVGRKLAFDQAGRRVGELGAWTETAVAAAQTCQNSQRLWLNEQIELFVDVLRPAPTLLLVGGAHIAVALAVIASVLDYRVVVIDPRRAFGSAVRFPHVAQVIQSWPDEALATLELGPETAVALLSHDPKIDDPALQVLLNSEVGYIGALGSPKTHASRVARLHKMGFDETAVARIHAPIGLRIGAKTPAEIALAIMGEIVQQDRLGAGS
ncbi:MAG: XdhC family protein [Anaerolineales bacterium]|nr:XdhC family protein [Anaerolineales bacterium]